MGSLIGKALALRNAASPVPLGCRPSNGYGRGSGLLMAGSGDEALLRAYSSNGTAYANISMLARSTAGPEWKLFRKAPADGRRRYTTSDQGSDQRVEVVNHQALRVLTTPAAIQASGMTLPVWTRFKLFELSGIWMESIGRSTWIVEYDPRASIPLGVWPARPDRMTPVPDPAAFLKGWVYTSPDGTEMIPLRPQDVIFNSYPDPTDPYGGVGPLASVLTDLDAARYSAEWNKNFFLNSAEPGGVLQADHTLSDDEFDDLTNRWREAHKGVNRAHRVALLEAGVTWVQTHQSMKDMDFSALRTTSRDIIREALAMHKVMTGVTDDVNRANAQTGEEVYSSWQVKPRLERWRDVLNSQFLPLFGSTGENVEFDFILPSPINREQDNAELKAKSEAAQALVMAGYDPSAVLEVVGLPDMPVAERATQLPGLPPGWVPDAAGAASDSSDSSDTADVAARLRELAPFNRGRVMLR